MNAAVRMRDATHNRRVKTSTEDALHDAYLMARMAVEYLGEVGGVDEGRIDLITHETADIVLFAILDVALRIEEARNLYAEEHKSRAAARLYGDG